MTKKDILKELKDSLDAKRYEHTIGVAYTAACLAMAYGMNPEQAYLAGLLHDCAKGLSDKERLNYCKKHNIEITDVESANPSLLHAKVGADMAKRQYDIDDTAILDAIRYHTTGKPNMTKLEEIIFVADYIEPMRNHDPELAMIRKEAFDKIESAIIHIYRNTLEYLKSSSKVLDDTTRQAYIYYSENI